MCAHVSEAIAQSTTALLRADLVLAETVISNQADVDGLSADAERRAFDLLSRQGRSSRAVRVGAAEFRILADIDRMSALAVHIAKLARHRHPVTVVPADVIEYVVELGRLTAQMATTVGEALTAGDVDAARRLRHDDDAVDAIHRHLFDLVIDRSWRHGVPAAVDVTLLSRYYERFADHAVSIGRLIARDTLADPRCPTAPPHPSAT